MFTYSLELKKRIIPEKNKIIVKLVKFKVQLAEINI